MEFRTNGGTTGINPLVSMVLPTFRPDAANLKRAVLSCLGQSYRNLELIIVDDGSGKLYDNVFSEIAQYDERIRVIHAKHAGVSCARNSGIELARGEYLCFIDDDDAYVPSFLSEAVQLILEHGLSAVFGNLSRVVEGEGANIQACPNNCDVTCWTGRDLRDLSDYFFAYQPPRCSHIPKWIFHGSVAKLFAKSAVEGVRFHPSLRWSEDGLFLSELTMNLDSVGLTDRSWYLYYRNPESAIHSLRLDDHLPDYFSVIKAESLRLGKDIQHCYSNVAIHFLSAMWHSYDADGAFPYEQLRSCLACDSIRDSFLKLDVNLFEIPRYRKALFNAIGHNHFLIPRLYCFCKGRSSF